MFLRKGDALLMAGDIEEAGRAYQQGLLQDVNIFSDFSDTAKYDSSTVVAPDYEV